MPKIGKELRRIFYFNVTYGCNSSCIYCYSHNTHHSSKTYNEISAVGFFDFLEANNISENDRVIINGGEPLLHSEIISLLTGLIKFNCEVLVYTNGRMLVNYDFSRLSSKFRFIVPIHGYEEIHDSITGVKGSFKESIKGLSYLLDTTNCLVDIKIIINQNLMNCDVNAARFIESLENVRLNNAVHLTKMADTLVSLKNGCTSVQNDYAAAYTKKLFEYFCDKGYYIKVFDTCIKELDLPKTSLKNHFDDFEVIFKDATQSRKLSLEKTPKACMDFCEVADKCKSAVDEYTVLEWFDGHFYVNME